MAAARIGINGELGVDQVAVVLDEPLDAVVLAALFVGRQRENQIALRLIALLLQAQKGRHQRGVAILHVLCAASVEVAVLFAENERVERPVGRLRFDHIEMPDEQNRPSGARSVIAHHQQALARRRNQHLYVVRRETGIAKPRRHRFGCLGVVAHRIRCVDLDQLPEHVAR